MEMEKPMGRPREGAEPKAILIVEDEILIRMALADDLMEAGFLVVQAADADEALAILHSSVPIDLIMTDVWMPGSMNGLELATYARSQWPELMIAVISAHIVAQPPEVDLFFSKPFAGEMVVECIRRLLDDEGAMTG